MNFSHVYGDQLSTAATVQKHSEINRLDFEAEGLALVVHPPNPYLFTVPR